MCLKNNWDSMMVIKYLIPKWVLQWSILGLRSEMLSATQGTTTVDSVFDSY
jgi:hypothetical protein